MDFFVKKCLQKKSTLSRSDCSIGKNTVVTCNGRHQIDPKQLDITRSSMCCAMIHISAGKLELFQVKDTRIERISIYYDLYRAANRSTEKIRRKLAFDPLNGFFRICHYHFRNQLLPLRA